MQTAKNILCAMLLALVMSVVLPGCATQREVVTQVVPVETPVYYCPAIDIQRPAFAVDALPLGADVATQMKHLRAERHQRIGYEQELEAALRQRNASAAQ